MSDGEIVPSEVSPRRHGGVTGLTKMPDSATIIAGESNSSEGEPAW